MLVGVPISLAFMGLVVLCQVGVRTANWYLGEHFDPDTKKVPVQYKYLPAVINAALVILFTKVYNKYALKLVLSENHRY